METTLRSSFVELLSFGIARRRSFRLSMACEWLLFRPSIYHVVRLTFSVFARSKNFVPGCFDPLRVNDDRPLPSLNPRAERVSYPPVFHQITVTGIYCTHGYHYCEWPQ
jgi:hypothetical protein